MNAVLLNFSGSNYPITNFLSSFVDGLKSGAVHIDSFEINSLQIDKCRGCTENIFFESNGDCLCEDDFRSIYPFLRQANFWLFSLNLEDKINFSKLINVFNRFEPLFSLNGTSLLSPKILSLIFAENQQNELLNKVIQEFENLALIFNAQFLGYVFRPDILTLSYLPMNLKIIPLFEEAYYRAGNSLATKGDFEKDTFEEIFTGYLPKDSLTYEIIQKLRKS